MKTERTDAVRIEQATWRENGKDIRRVRMEVFVEEQGFAEEIDFDGLDAEARHFLAFAPSGEAVGTARVLEDGRIGRMAVLKALRGRGIGSLLLEAAIETARASGCARVYLHSQIAAQGFYEKFGFVREGEEFDEDGVAHCNMARPAAKGE